jgi:hypothetical protein
MKSKPTKSIHYRLTSKHNPYLLYFILLIKVKHQFQTEAEIDVFFEISNSFKLQNTNSV